jgi:hypothetical protein
MDPQSLTQIASIWPDVAGPFDEIIPGGLRLVCLEDEWRGGDAIRRRKIELTPEPGAPALEDLLEEATHDAFRMGWTPLDEGRFELENVILTLETIEDRIAAEFLQPWPDDFLAPVETSEMFQNLVRKLLRLGADPARLAKHIVVNPLQLMTADVVDETVEMPSDEDLTPRFDEVGFTREGSSWISRETTATHHIEAWVEKRSDWVVVRMRKSRLLS